MEPKMELTSRERRDLIGDIILTLIIEALLYMSVIFVCFEMIDYPFKFTHFQGTLRGQLALSDETISLFYFFVTFMFVITGITYVIWRINRLLKHIYFQHVMDAVKYISKGNYDYRIPESDFSEIKEVVSSVNHLVDSTVHAMEEERKIEKTKDELIANVGHDLRTPLTSIIGYLGLIENKQYKTEEELLDYSHIAYRKAQQMQTLVSDLLFYTVSRQTSYVIQPQRIQMATFLEQILADFEVDLSKKDIEAEIVIEPQNLELILDVEKMARVYHNLLSNVLKYGHGATKVVLTAKCMQDSKVCQCNLDDSENNCQIRLEVCNDGELIPEDQLEVIFSRSYRADQARQSDVGGAGLGLAIVKNIVELHHGHVYAIVEDQQLKFRMELPQRIDKVTKDEH
ncbi:sensor histidine kinase [Vaginisenegalia massiliensis]|uniref:sensor histidine kinase n=1 Tax=Vaginisenegalia massiliensis TaxID=2058294 RepID=UPI000F524549|nr:HAMP domain-containing sensor histidine kinase [Vaginisenegalia massiliensis]